jgi:hypothetical protein
MKTSIMWSVGIVLLALATGCGGGSTKTRDTTPPVITLLGDNPMHLTVGQPYTEPGATAVDETDGNITVTITGTVDTTVAGTYTRLYTAVDQANNEANTTRTVHVTATVDTTPPVITLNGDNPMVVIQNAPYSEPNATAVDDTDGNITVTITGTVDTTVAGTYTRLYTAVDQANNESNITREVIVVSDALSSSTFPVANYPANAGATPRLWLTTERLTALQNAQTNNTTRWQAFKDLCDSMIDSDPGNDPWDLSNRPQNYTAPLALMYRLTGTSAYANKALEIMDRVDDNLSCCGDPDHQSWYFLGLTYDWLHDYSEMNATRLTHYRTLMKSISDQFYAEDQTASGTDSDFNLLTALHHLVMGIAMYGDDTVNATTLLDRAWQGWSHGYCVATEPCTTNREMVKAGFGGVYFTGMAYFPSTDIVGISGFWMSLASACGYDINTQEPDLKPFWGNILHAIIDLIEPARTAIFDYGSWQDPNTLSTQPWMRRTLQIATDFADHAGDTTAGDLGRGLGQTVNVGDWNDPFLEFFYDTPDGNATDPYAASLPKVTFHASPDFLLFRDGWDENASWGVFRGDGSLPLDQRGMDMGSFSLWRQGGYLTKGARNYESLSHGDFYNTLSLENGCTLNGTPCSGTAIFDSQAAATISRHRTSDSPLLAYSMLQADGQWDDRNTTTSPTDNIDTYRRHFVWFGQYSVVFDRVRAHQSIDIRWRLRALVEPTLNGTTIRQSNPANSARLLSRILEPGSVTLTKRDESSLWSGIPTWVVDSTERHYQTTFDTTAKSLNILHVMQIGDNTLSTFDTLEHLTGNDNSGVRIGDRVACFHTAEGLRTAATYTVHSAAAHTWHLVTDLVTGTYRLNLNGTYNRTLTVTDTDQAAWFETNTTGDITVSLTQTP